jgi:hypothetical protein
MFKEEQEILAFKPQNSIGAFGLNIKKDLKHFTDPAGKPKAVHAKEHEDAPTTKARIGQNNDPSRSRSDCRHYPSQPTKSSPSKAKDPTIAATALMTSTFTADRRATVSSSVPTKQ